MSPDEKHLTTEILNRFAAGDGSLEEQVVERIHEELRLLAEAQMARGAAARTLQPTALVHEAWLRLARTGEVDFEGRRQFFHFAAKLMRNLLIDNARAGGTARREPGLTVSGFEPEVDAANDVDALDLAEAIERLEKRDAELARVLELRLLCGLTNADVADTLDCSVRTAERRWRLARAWLVGELEAD